MRFAVNENTLITCDLPDFLNACSGAGFPAVEISYRKLQEILRFIPAEALQALVNDLGMEILSLNAFEDVFLVPDSGLSAVTAEARVIGELCRAIGCPAVVLPASRWYLRYGLLPDRSEMLKQYRSRLLLFKSLFGEYGIEVLFEPIAYPEFVVGTPDEVNDLLLHKELEGLRIVPDVHNLHRNGLGPEQLLQFRNRIGIFHIDDTVTGELEQLHVAFDRTFPGSGTARAADWVGYARRAGYDGYYSLELFNDDLYAMKPADAAGKCMEQLQRFALACGE